MERSQFKTDSAGEVRQMPSGYLCFIPKAPPIELDFNPFVLLLSRADAALSELSGTGRYLPNPHLLIRPYLRREAAASTRVEGTQADMNDLLVDEVVPKSTASSSDVGEIRNYVDAIEQGIMKLQVLPFAGRLVRELHAILMQGVRGDKLTPGEFRTSQNWIGGSGPSDATFVPPPPDELWRCFGEWEQFANNSGRLPDLVQCALLHAHFETLHPFLDGNGRIGRLLMMLFLIHRRRLSAPLLYTSAYIEQNKSEYYDRLQRTRTHADWTGWVIFILTAIERSARGAVIDANKLISLQKSLHDRDELNGKFREQRLCDQLFDNPYINIARAKKLLGVSDTTASRIINKLQSIGILEEVTGKSWGRVWVARPVLAALSFPGLEQSPGN